MTTNRFTAVVPMLEVRDLRETLAFYEGLGFSCADRLEVDGDLLWALVRRDNAHLMFTWSPPHEHGADDDHTHGPSLAGSLYFYPEDVDATWAELRDKGRVVEELSDREYGMRDFSLEDPNGFLLTFGAPPASSAE